MKKIIFGMIFALLCLSRVARATVTNTSFSVSYSCSGSTGPYAFTFPISTAAAMTVIQNGTVLATYAYTIAPVNNNYSNGGSVTLNVSCPSPQTLVLQRVTPLTQTTNYYDNMPLPYTSFMSSLDKLTEITQEVSAVADGSPLSGSCPSSPQQYLTGISNTGISCVIGTSTNPISGQSANTIPIATSSVSIGAQSHITEIGGQDVFSQPVVAPSIPSPGPIGGSAPNAITNSIANGVYNPASCSASTAPSWCAGTDIGGWSNAALAACSAGCTVSIPVGTYNYSTSISIPTTASGNYHLVCDLGAVLHYTGSGAGIQMAPSVNVSGDSGNTIENCTITGTSSGAEGILLKTFYGAQILNPTVSGFSNGTGIFLQGSGTVTITPNLIVSNRNGIVMQPATATFGGNFQANANRIIGGTIGSNTNWGIEDLANASLGSSVPDQKNVISSTLENNGTTSNSATGNIFLQLAENDSISASYLEQTVSPTNVQIGDGTYQVRGGTIRDSYIYTNVTGATYSIFNDNSLDLSLQDDQDDSILPSSSFLPQLIYQGASSSCTHVRNYRAANLNTSNTLVGYASGAAALCEQKNPAFGGPNDNGVMSDLIPSQTAPSVGTADANVYRRQMLWVPGTTPALVSQQTFTVSSPWKIVFHAVFIDDATAPSTAALPAYLEINSSSNTIVVDAFSTLTFSQNASGQIQAVNSSTHNVSIIGTIEILGNNENVAGAGSIQVPGNIQGAALISLATTTTKTGTSGTAVCSQSLQGNLKTATCFLSGYANTGAAQTYAYPMAFGAFSLLIGTTTGGTSCGTYNPTSTTSTLTLPANAAMTGETCSITVIGQ